MAAAPEDLLDAVGDGVVLLQRSGHGSVVTWASRAFAASTGLDAASLIGRPPTFLTLPQDGADPSALDALFHGPGISVRAGILTPRGQRAATISWRAVDRSGSAVLVTVLELAAAGLCRVQLPAAVAPGIGSFDYDVEADRVELSPECYGMRGLPTVPRSERGAFLRSVHPDDRARVGDALEQLIEGRTDEWDADVRVPTAAGDWRWVQERLFVVDRDAAGRARRIAGLWLDVDARKRAETQLAGSESRYRAAVAMSPGFIHESGMTANGRFVMRWASEGLTRILGWTVDEVNAVGGVAALIHPDDKAEGEARRADVLAGKPVQLQMRLRAKSGGWVWFAATGVPRIDPHTGRVESMLGSVHDITTLKQAEADLRASEERFLLALDAVGGIMYERDVASGRISSASGAADVLGFGSDAENPLLESWMERIHPDDLGRVRAEMTGNDDGRRIVTSRFRVRHADGHYVELLDRSVRVRDEAGAVVRVIGCAIDVSRESRIERLLSEAEALAHVGSWELDLRSGAVTWSDETYRIFGVERGSYAPHRDSPLPFCAPGGASFLQAALRRASESGAGFDLEFEIDTAAGVRCWVRATGRAELADGEPTRLFGAIQDIDALKRSDLRIQERSDWQRLAMDAARMLAWRWQPADDRLVVEYRSPAFDPDIPIADTLAEDLLDALPEERERVRGVLERTALTGEPADFTLHTRDRRGRRRWLATRVIRATSDGGAFVIGATSDITARRTAEEALRASEAVLRSVSENSPDYIIVTDAELKVTFVNRRLHGATPQHVLDELFAPAENSERGELHERLRSVLATGRPLRFESRGQRADGNEALFENRVGPVHQAGRVAGVIVYSTDITERRALEREILEVSNREQRRIGSDLHDGLGQELTGIALLLRGITSTLDRGEPLRVADLEEVVGLVNGAIETTRTLARGLSPIALEGGGLVDALRALVARARDMYGLNIHFRGRVAAPITLDAAATGHLYRIAQESLTNAARHAHATAVTVRLTATADRVSLAVTDDGRGFGSATSPGMGLKIMRYRAHMLGADLTIEAGNERRGTRISCTVHQAPPTDSAEVIHG